MKNLFLLLTVALTLSCCNNDDDTNTSTNPINQLPPATQTGENTFGALLDGEVFIPSGGTNPLDCVYQLVSGQYFFGLQGNKRDEDFNRITLSISTNAKELEEGQSYQLIENEIGNAYATYSFATNATTTSSNNSGTLTITKLDLDNQIISGTFSFDIIDFEGNLRQIRDGRFDMQFTQ
ncbi:hypothetical protein NBRC110019_22190 [Neptunitalea chrysea]|uniref:Lipoprotein n=1 Tax=Neptunitalea chrysea TaxID=1647581 RepID=A0A9W6EUY9_9FLAO|nr:hypothetical protein [Neptunitalea chrysea]GLB53179.1 hypothetical protein NBRC110019_22190 [Neptunitalea chrysea]